MLLFILGVEEAAVNNGCKKREHNIMKPAVHREHEERHENRLGDITQI